MTVTLPSRSRNAKSTIIHVNMHIIRENRTNGTNLPALTVKNRGKTHRAHEAIIDGPSKVIYRPDKPLHCGARCWIETDSEVELQIRDPN